MFPCFADYTNFGERKWPGLDYLVSEDPGYLMLMELFYENILEGDGGKFRFEFMSFMPQYQVAGGRGLPASVSFVKQLLAEATETAYLDDFVGHNFFANGYLNSSDIARAQDDGSSDLNAVEIDRAAGKAYLSGAWERNTAPTDSVSFFQSCFGLPGILSEGHAICISCPMKAACQQARRVVNKLVL